MYLKRHAKGSYPPRPYKIQSTRHKSQNNDKSILVHIGDIKFYSHMSRQSCHVSHHVFLNETVAYKKYVCHKSH